MSKEDKLDELAEQIVQTGNHLAGGTWYEFDRVREQLDTKKGRDSLTSELNLHINGFSLAMYYDDDNKALVDATDLVNGIQELDSDREME